MRPGVVTGGACCWLWRLACIARLRFHLLISSSHVCTVFLIAWPPRAFQQNHAQRAEGGDTTSTLYVIRSTSQASGHTGVATSFHRLCPLIYHWYLKVRESFENPHGPTWPYTHGPTCHMAIHMALSPWPYKSLSTRPCPHGPTYHFPHGPTCHHLVIHSTHPNLEVV